jgi:alpha-galactosidase
MVNLRNPYLCLRFDPQSGEWNLAPAGDASAAVERARIAVTFHAGKSRLEWIFREARIRPAALRTDPFHGRSRTFAAETDAGGGLRVRIDWCLPLRRPFLIWKATLTNRGGAPLSIDAIDLCRTGPRYGAAGGVRLPIGPARRAMFVNGWQTWSFAGGLRSADRQPGPKFGPVNTAMSVGTARRPSGKPGHFVSEMFTAIGEETGRDNLVAGFLAQREQFGLVETWLGDENLSLRMEADADGVRLDAGKSLSTDRACLWLGAAASAADYFDAAARENRARAKRAAPEGWSSWYYYYSAVRQADLERNIAAAAALQPRLPLRLIQLDDGFQAEVGDWYERNKKFPAPMGELSARIRRAGFLPGVWLSPFLIRLASHTARDHPDWLAGKARGVMSNVNPAGVRETRSLDVTRPEVLDHVRRLIRTAVRDWKFPFLKLDFLYLPAAKGVRLYDQTLTRAQALRKALEQIREAAGEGAYLLGCGCPLGSGIGIFDAMRIGPDVDSIWKPNLFHQTWAGRGDPTIPAAWNAVRNMLARAPLHRRWWWNDPDCLLARDRETRLTPDERRTLATAIALSGGMVLLSDNLGALSNAAIRLAQVLFPPLHRAADLPSWRGEAASSTAVLPMIGPQGKWWVIGVFNWGDRPAGRFVDVRELTGLHGEATAFSFWDERLLSTAGGQLGFAAVPAHGVILLAVRPKGIAPQYVGSNLHYSQGSEAAEWKPSRESLRTVIRLGREAEGAVWLALPGEPASAELDGKPVAPREIAEKIWKFPVRIAGEGVLIIRWKGGGRRQ